MAALTRAEFIALARTWIDTPCLPSGAIKGVGASCGGLFLGIFREAGLDRLASLFAAYEGFSRPPERRVLMGHLREAFDKTRAPEPADVLMIAFENGQAHMGLLTEPGRVLHADRGIKRVIEHRLVHRFDSGWRIRELA